MFLKSPILSLSLLASALLLSCGEKKECPGFSDNLVPYMPQENRLVFHNSAGDSLVINTSSYERIGPHTEKQNVLSVGGTGSKPYCVSYCKMESSYNDLQKQEIYYKINVDNEALTCTLSVNLKSSIPTIDYFLTSAAYSSEGRPFGDTLKLDNSTPTTSPRYSRIEIVYGRGITRIQDDVKKCLWVR